jgi:hypothetical protein
VVIVVEPSSIANSRHFQLLWTKTYRQQLGNVGFEDAIGSDPGVCFTPLLWRMGVIAGNKQDRHFGGTELPDYLTAEPAGRGHALQVPGNDV